MSQEKYLGNWYGLSVGKTFIIKYRHKDVHFSESSSDQINNALPFTYKELYGELHENKKPEVAPFEYPIDKSGIIHFRIRENYNYIISSKNIEEICLIDANENSIQWEKVDNSILFSVSGFLGATRIKIEEETVLCLEVVPTKIDYDTDFQLMTDELSEMFSQLLMDWNAPTYLSFSDSAEEFKTLYEQFIAIKHLLDSEKLNSSLQIIKRNPHHRLIDESKWETSCSSNFSGFLKDPLKNGRDWDPKSRRPNEIYSSKRRVNIDTPPNQFVKYTIQHCHQICSSIIDFIESKNSKKNYDIIKSEVLPVMQNIENIILSEFFKEINIIKRIPFDNQTLQKRTGYREILRAWIGIQLSKAIDWEDRKEAMSADVRNVAKLYEFWLFFKLEKIIKSITGVKVLKNSIFKSSNDGLLSISLKEGKESIFPFEFINENGEFSISLYYNRIFSSNENKSENKAIRGSYSRQFRPDYTIVFYSGDNEDNAVENGTIAYLHFDAKYRLDKDFGKIFSNEKEEEKELNDEENEIKVKQTYKRGDLYKMHTYNDAILKTVGSYILYPGDNTVSDNKMKYFTAYHEVLPGVGAFAIKPIKKEYDNEESLLENDHLKKFIEDCFKIQSNKFSQLYQLQQEVHDVVRHPSLFPAKKVETILNSNKLPKINYFSPPSEKKPPSEIFIITGFVKKGALKSILDSNKFWWHAIEKDKINKKSKIIICQGKINEIDSNVFKANYLLLKVDGKLTGHYGRILSIKLVPEKAESLPDPMNRTSAKFYYCVEVDKFDMSSKIKDLEVGNSPLPISMKWSDIFIQDIK